MFELSYESLDHSPASWKAALVPWDSETFGFNVAVLEAEKPQTDLSTEELGERVRSYAKARNISMIIASVPGENQPLNLFLQRTGFVHVDIALSIQYSMSTFQSRAHQIILREAKKEDVLEIADIAERAFTHGRYHLDDKIPENLANRRYRDWVLRTQMEGGSQQLMVAERQGCCCGFSILEHKKSQGYLHLMALDPEWRGKGLGVEIIDLSLDYLKKQGADVVKSKVSASNRVALNMYFALGARFMACDHLLHWHAF
jgi:ribosomal protein S18 acetylase RimI-like enzyme